MEEPKRKLTLDRPVTYQIQVPGHLDDGWSDWVEGMTIAAGSEMDGSPVTTLTCTVDQAALHGLLRRLYSLGLPLISVHYVECSPGGKQEPRPMDRQALINSIAYCGLVCGRCHLRAECDFCRNTANLCDRSDVCYQRNCCTQRRLQGCWECPDFPCGEDMHAPPHDLRIRAFVSFIKAEGAATLIDCLLANEARGIHYGHGRDYDGKNSEGEVIRLLKAGLSGSPSNRLPAEEMG